MTRQAAKHHQHRKLIVALGGSPTVAKRLNLIVRGDSSLQVTPQAVCQWSLRGVPWKWRCAVATLASLQKTPVPKGFLPPLGRPVETELVEC